MSFTAWKGVQWHFVEQRVLQYQHRIYRASASGNKRKTRCLQRRLLASLDAKLHSVRRVSTLNKGSRTPGVDKVTYVRDKEKVK